jgi:hypothetical protein
MCKAHNGHPDDAVSESGYLALVLARKRFPFDYSFRNVPSHGDELFLEQNIKETN